MVPQSSEQSKRVPCSFGCPPTKGHGHLHGVIPGGFGDTDLVQSMPACCSHVPCYLLWRISGHDSVEVALAVR